VVDSDVPILAGDNSLLAEMFLSMQFAISNFLILWVSS